MAFLSHVVDDEAYRASVDDSPCQPSRQDG